MYGAVALLLLLAFSAAAPVQESPTQTTNTVRLSAGVSRPKAQIADVAWLAGRWEGEGLGGSFDEVWSDPVGGTMVGYFRLVREGKAVFYEILTRARVGEQH